MAHSVGLEPVSQCVQAELFSTDIRSVGSGVVGVFSGLTIAATGFLLPLMLEAWGFSGMFFAFAAVALVSFVFGYFVLPESMGKSLVAMEETMDVPKEGKENEACMS